MQIDRADDTAEVLREVLDIALHDLNCEIAAADLPSCRKTLRDKREKLQGVLVTLGGAIPNAERLKK